MSKFIKNEGKMLKKCFRDFLLNYQNKQGPFCLM